MNSRPVRSRRRPLMGEHQNSDPTLRSDVFRWRDRTRATRHVFRGESELKAQSTHGTTFLLALPVVVVAIPGRIGLERAGLPLPAETLRRGNAPFPGS